MRVVHLVVCLWVMVTLTLGEEVAPWDKVEEVTDTNFDDNISGDQPWFLLFYSDWCGEPCIQHKEMMQELSEQTTGTLKVGRVRHDQDLILRLQVHTYPTFLFIRKGQYFVYLQNRTAEAVIDFAATSHQKFIPNDIPPKEEVKTYVVDLTDANFDSKVMAKYGAYWGVLFCDKKDVDCTNLEVHYDELAKKEKGRLNIGYVEVPSNPITAERFGSEVPKFFVFRAGKKYTFGDDYHFSDMYNFVEGRYKKVEAEDVAPLNHEYGSEVFILNDKNFDVETQAMNKKAPFTWLVEFYAPWCGHCKSLAPIWEEVAGDLKHSMRVAKIDCIENKNTSDRFETPGFPTLLLFKKGVFWKYDGKLRTKEALVSWATKEYNEGDNPSGWLVPPPLGQPLPEPTWQDKLAAAPQEIQAMAEYNFPATLGLVISGGLLGSICTGYILVVKALFGMASGPAPKGRPGKRRPRK